MSFSNCLIVSKKRVKIKNICAEKKIGKAISKFDSVAEYEAFLTEIFTDHVGVKDDVMFQKVSWARR